MSRPVSRSCSKMGGKVGGGEGVIEEEGEGDWEWEYYYKDELNCMSPALTYAPTTRATSPFPGSTENNISFDHSFHFSRFLDCPTFKLPDLLFFFRSLLSFINNRIALSNWLWGAFKFGSKV